MKFVRVLQAVKGAVRHELAACIIRICVAVSQTANNPLSGSIQLGERLPVLAVKAYPVIVYFRNVNVIKIHCPPTANSFRQIPLWLP